jgi:hypothetical protein
MKVFPVVSAYFYGCRGIAWEFFIGLFEGNGKKATEFLEWNIFVNHNIGRFPEIIEDEPPIVRLLWETQTTISIPTEPSKLVVLAYKLQSRSAQP